MVIFTFCQYINTKYVFLPCSASVRGRRSSWGRRFSGRRSCPVLPDRRHSSGLPPALWWGAAPRRDMPPSICKTSHITVNTKGKRHPYLNRLGGWLLCFFKLITFHFFKKAQNNQDRDWKGFYFKKVVLKVPMVELLMEDARKSFAKVQRVVSSGNVKKSTAVWNVLFWLGYYLVTCEAT